MSDRWVVDASVVVKLFIDEDLSDQARAFAQRLVWSEPDLFFAPDLLYPECANVLWKYVRQFGYGADLARSNLADLTDLAITPTPTAGLLHDAFELALEQGVAVYDACYVTLAQHLECSLVSAEGLLARRMMAAGFPVIFLGDLPEL